MFSQNSILEGLAKFLKLDSLKEDVLGYVEARVQLLKLEVKEDIAKAITRALVFGVILFMAFLFIVFFSLGVALFINRYFNDSYVGFGMVAAFYLILFIISLAFRKPLFHKLEHLFSERLKHKE
jgi:uncharacterized membrane protein YqjE